MAQFRGVTYLARKSTFNLSLYIGVSKHFRYKILAVGLQTLLNIKREKLSCQGFSGAISRGRSFLPENPLLLFPKIWERANNFDTKKWQ